MQALCGVVSHLLHDVISFVQSLGAGMTRCWAYEQSIIISRLAQDVKETILGGNLVSLIPFFKILAFIYLFVFLNYI